MVLAVLKFAGVIGISWFWVFLPVLIEPIVIVSTLVLCFLTIVLGGLI